MWKQHGQNLGNRPQKPKRAPILMAPTKSLWYCAQIILSKILDSYSLIPSRAPGPVMKKEGNLYLEKYTKLIFYLFIFKFLGKKPEHWWGCSKERFGVEVGDGIEGRWILDSTDLPFSEVSSSHNLANLFLWAKLPSFALIPRFSVLSLDSCILTSPNVLQVWLPILIEKNESGTIC